MKYLLTGLLSLFFFHSICVGQSVLRGPYLQMIGQESVIIRWRTDTDVNSKVWYGTNPNTLTQTQTNNALTTEHQVSLSGLTPNSIYYYAIGTTSGQLAGANLQHYFKTSPETSIAETINIWVLGDAGKGGAPQREVRDAFYDHHGNAPIDLTLLLGDNAYNDGTDVQYQDTWFVDMYEDRLIHTTMFSTYGNHDAYSSNSTTETGPYFDVFNHPENAEIGGVPSNSEAWYSFDYGDVHFISLNSYDTDLSIGGAQYQWLLDDLQNNDKGWLIAFWHYPPHDARNLSSDLDARDIAMRENYNPILEQYGVDLVLSGHSHSYQRSFLIADYFGYSNQFDPAIHGVNMGDGQADGNGVYDKGLEDNGTVYMVTGSAGSIAAVTDELEHPAMFYTQMVTGSVRLQISHDELFAEFITNEGIVADYFTIKKTLPPVGPAAFQITNPNREGYALPQPIIVTTEFLDTTDAISSISYYVNGVLTSVKTVYPFNMNYNIPANGDYIISATALTVNGLEYTDQVSFHVGPITVCKTVYSETNDAEEKATGIVSVSSSDLELTFDGSIQQIGLRYSALRIPKSAIIHEAKIQFTADNINNINPCQITIHGEAANNAAFYTTTAFSISSRPKTQAFVNWSPPSWTIIGQSGTNQLTPNLNSIVQQIVNRPGYNTNSAIAFILSGTGRRTATSFDGNPSGSPDLCVKYTPLYPTDSDGDGTVDSEDICFGGLEPGAACNDSNPNTHHDTIGPDCICAGIGFDCPALGADIGTPCNDNNPATYNDVVNANCQCVGTLSVFQCPLLLLNIGDPCNDNNANTYGDVVNANCNCAGFTLGTTTTITIAVTTSSDDAEQKSTGTVTLISSDLELVDDAGLQTVGVRFPGVTIPSGAVITTAYIQFTTDGTSFIDPCTLNIYGERSLNPLTFVNQAQNISSRLKTVTSKIWTPPLWTQVGESGLAQRTTDLKDIIAEVFQQPGYQSGSALAFIIEGIGRRRAVAYDGNPLGAPRLVIQYALPCSDNDTDGICNSQDPCPNLAGVPGNSCNDNNTATYNDVITANCSCVGTPWDCPGLLANIGSPCNDNNPATNNDVVNANCQCAGSTITFQCPELSLNIGDPCNDNDPNTVSDMVNANCQCMGSFIQVTTLTIPIVASSNDAEQRSIGSVTLTSSDLELMVDGTDVQKVGLRFQNPGIPLNADILSAYIQFTADNSSNQNPSNIQIFGEDVDNSAEFVKVNNNISQRIKTNSMVPWIPANNWVSGEAGVKQQTTDLTAIVEEIMSRPGYQYNNPITFLLEGTGVRVATSFDGNPASAARLVLQFSINCIDNDDDGICNELDACPENPSNPGASCDDGNPGTFGDAIDENCNCVGYTPGDEICAKINNGSNDAEERVDGTMKLTSSDIDLVVDGSLLQIVGLRFTGLNIPPGVIISSAHLQFTTDKTTNLNPCLLSIYGEAANNPPKYEKTNGNISSRTKTDTKVDWAPANWLVVGESGTAQQSADISSVIQELVNRPGYLSSDAINLIINGNGSRVAMAFEKSAAQAPELCIAYASEPLQGEADENQDDTQKDYAETKQLSIFPNPASENLTLIFDPVKADKELSLQIVDVNGKVLLSQFHQLSRGEGRIELTGLELENGVYFVRLKDDENFLAGQFVVVN
jgi:Calcineurin-like phosphoesterase/Secretion system C-terminal sorting domain/Purple acid Phosphatase, N-terminal domain